MGSRRDSMMTMILFFLFLIVTLSALSQAQTTPVVKQPKPLYEIKATWGAKSIVLGTTTVINFSMKGFDLSTDQALILSTPDALGIVDDLANMATGTNYISPIPTFEDLADLDIIGMILGQPLQGWKQFDIAITAKVSFRQDGVTTLHIDSSRLPTTSDLVTSMVIKFEDDVDLSQLQSGTLEEECKRYCCWFSTHEIDLAARTMTFLDPVSAATTSVQPYIGCTFSWPYQSQIFSKRQMRDALWFEVEFWVGGRKRQGVSAMTGGANIPIYFPTIGKKGLRLLSNSTWITETTNSPQVRYSATFRWVDNFDQVTTQVKNPRLVVSFLNDKVPFAMDQLDGQMRCGMTVGGKDRELKMVSEPINTSWIAEMGNDFGGNHFSIDIMCSFIIGNFFADSQENSSDIIFTNELVLRVAIVDYIDQGHYGDKKKRFPRFLADSMTWADANFDMVVVQAESYIPELGLTQAVAHITTSYILPHINDEWIQRAQDLHEANALKVLEEWAIAEMGKLHPQQTDMVGIGVMKRLGWIDQRRERIKSPPKTLSARASRTKMSMRRSNYGNIAMGVPWKKKSHRYIPPLHLKNPLMQWRYGHWASSRGSIHLTARVICLGIIPGSKPLSPQVSAEQRARMSPPPTPPPPPRYRHYELGRRNGSFGFW